jgi:hypothetical protein
MVFLSNHFLLTINLCPKYPMTEMQNKHQRKVKRKSLIASITPFQLSEILFET